MTYVRVTGDDWSRLGPEAGRWAHFVENRAYMRMQNGHCAALEVKRMPSGVVDFFCAIYARRPATCRDLGRGSAECLAELDRKAQAVAVAVQ